MKKTLTTNQSDRRFQLWEYQVSHGQLLIRSPKSPAIGPEPAQSTNLDLVFLGVEYLALPRLLRGLSVVSPTPDEVRDLEQIVGPSMPGRGFYIVASGNRRFPVVAVTFYFDENDWHFMDSPFETGSRYRSSP